MSMFVDQSPAKNNWILNAIPLVEQERLLPHFEHVALPQSQTLFIPNDVIHHVYFPNSGMVSLVSLTEEGSTIEIGMVGNEGVVGITVILGTDTIPYQAEVQIPGDAIRIRATILLEEFNRGGEFQKVLLRYTGVLIAQLSQSAVCNRFHTMKERLSKWLLVSRDRAKSSSFRLTQDDLSHMLGTYRPNVTAVARMLQNEGLINYSRGRMMILDEGGLESAACECYQVVKDSFDKFIGS